MSLPGAPLRISPWAWPAQAARPQGLETHHYLPSRASSPSVVWTWWTPTPPAQALTCVAQVSFGMSKPRWPREGGAGGVGRGSERDGASSWEVGAGPQEDTVAPGLRGGGR